MLSFKILLLNTCCIHFKLNNNYKYNFIFILNNITDV